VTDEHEQTITTTVLHTYTDTNHNIKCTYWQD